MKIVFKTKTLFFLLVNIFFLFSSKAQVTFEKIEDDLCESNGVIRVINDSFTLPYELTVTYPNLTVVTNNIFNDTILLENLSGANGGVYTLMAVSSSQDTVEADVVVLQETISDFLFVTTAFSNNGYAVACNGDCDAEALFNITPLLGGVPTGTSYTINWYEDSVVAGQEFFTTTQNNHTVTDLCAGQYALLLVSPTGCESIRYYNLVEPETFQVSAVSSQVLCAGGNQGAIDLNVVGGVGPTYNSNNDTYPDTLDYSYSWTGPNGYSSSFENISTLEGGTYNVTITDNNNCSFDTSFVVLDTLPQINISLVNIDSVSCFGGSDGSIEVSATGGSGTLEYSIDGVIYQSDGIFENLSANNYVISVRDTNSCIETLNVNVEQFDQISIDSIAVENILCGDSLGSVELFASGGTELFTYSLVNPQVENLFEDLEEDDYTFTVFDSNNCFVDTTVSITRVNNINVNLVINPVSCFGLNDGELNVIINGGTAPFTLTLDTITQFNNTNFSNIEAGNYILSIQDANNCPFDTLVTFSQPSEVTVSLVDVDSTRCFGSSDGQLNVTVSGGVGNYSYFWRRNNSPLLSFTTNQSNTLEAGLYTLVVSDADACSSEEFEVEIFEPTPLIINVDDIQNLSCDESGDGAITISPSGGTSPYNILWQDLSTLSTIENLDAGDYNVTLTDQNSCDTTITITVTQPDTLLLQLTQFTDVNCFGESTGELNLTVNGGTSDYSFSITPNTGVQSSFVNSFVASDLSAQTYLVSVNDQNDCEFSQEYIISQNSEITANFTSVEETCGDNNAEISVVVSGGIPDYSYTWAGLSDTTSTIDSLLGGFTYNLTVEDDLNCITEFSHFVGNVFPISIDTVEGVDISCNGNGDGQILFSVLNGTSPFVFSVFENGVMTYDLTTLSNVDTINNINPGTYTFQVEDANGCVALYPFPVTIDEPNPLTIEIDSARTTFDLLCYDDVDGEIFFNFNGGTQYPGGNYDLFVNNPVFSEQISTDSITGLSFGTYNMTLQDANGCLSSISHTINQPNPLSVSSQVSDVLCFGESTGSALIFVSGATPNYSISSNSPQALITQLSVDTFEITNLSEGSYFFDIDDANNCGTLNYSLYVDEPNSLEVLDINSTLESCLGGDGTAFVNVSGGTSPYIYFWSYDANPNTNPLLVNGQPNATGQTANPINLSEGLHYVHIWDFNGCYVLDSIEVNKATSPSLSLVGTTNNLCNEDEQGQITVNAIEGNPFYQYSIDGGVNYQFVPIFDNLAANIYTVTVRDSLGCTDAVEGIIITEPDAISIIVDAQSVRCIGDNNGSANVVSVEGGTSASGQYSYQWKTIDGVNLWPANLTANSSVVSDLAVGYYMLEVEDDNGCTSFYDSVYVGEPTQVEVDLSIISNYNGTQISCFGAQDGSIMAQAYGGTGEFLFVWNNGTTNLESNTAAAFDTLSSLGEGTYYITVNDENGCSNTNQISLSHPDPISISFIDHIDIRCEGNTDGQTTVIWSGGSGIGTYNVVWTDQDNNIVSLLSQANNLDVGVYTATVYDNNGCSVSNTDTIDYSEQFMITNSLDTTLVSCNGAIDGSFDFQPQGGWPPYTHSWNDPLNQTSSTAYGLAPGNWYIDVIMDSEGCVVYDSVYVDEPNTLVNIINVDVDEAECFGENSGSITLDVVGGTEPYSYSWQGPDFSASTQDIQDLSAGIYSLVVTDLSGCQDFGSYQVEEPESPLQIVSVSTQDVDCNGNNTGEVTNVVVTGGTGNSDDFIFNYGGENPFELTAGDYDLVVTDNNGCTDIAYFTIYEPEVLEATVDLIDENCEGQNGHIIVQASGGSTFNDNTYNYSIFPDYQQSASNEADILVNFPSPGEIADTIFTVTITDRNGCVLNISDLNLHPARLFDYNATYEVCYNDTFELSTKYNDYYNFVWNVSPEESFTSEQNSISVVATQNSVVTVTATDMNNCSFSDQVNLVVNVPVVNLGDDVGIIRGEEIMLSVFEGEAPYQWSNLETSQDIYVSPLVTSYYSVSALDTSNNCFGTDTIRVYVNMNEGFTPNGDGFNDQWQIDYLNQYSGLHIEVFNRWGSLLWKSDAPNISNWDGKHNGKDLPVGTYYYIITFDESQNKEPITGPITIVR